MSDGGFSLSPPPSSSSYRRSRIRPGIDQLPAMNRAVVDAMRSPGQRGMRQRVEARRDEDIIRRGRSERDLLREGDSAEEGRAMEPRVDARALARAQTRRQGVIDLAEEDSDDDIVFTGQSVPVRPISTGAVPQVTHRQLDEFRQAMQGECTGLPLHPPV
jgi:hypothetical protein